MNSFVWKMFCWLNIFIIFASENQEREAFFVNQLSHNHVVEYSKSSADFNIDHQYTIEVGGRSKDGKQIANIPNSYIAADGEEYVIGNKIPLWLFGFLN